MIINVTVQYNINNSLKQQICKAPVNSPIIQTHRSANYQCQSILSCSYMSTVFSTELESYTACIPSPFTAINVKLQNEPTFIDTPV